LGTLATLLILSVFRLIEMRLPSEFYAHHALKFDRKSVLPEDELRSLIGGHGFSIANLAHRLSDDGSTFEYRMIIRSRDRRKAESLSKHLREMPQVREFRISPTGD
jgi:putative Mg2+ transporter-C (MgtC) family protein